MFFFLFLRRCAKPFRRNSNQQQFCNLNPKRLHPALIGPRCHCGKHSSVLRDPAPETPAVRLLRRLQPLTSRAVSPGLLKLECEGNNLGVQAAEKIGGSGAGSAFSAVSARAAGPSSVNKMRGGSMGEEANCGRMELDLSKGVDHRDLLLGPSSRWFLDTP